MCVSSMHLFLIGREHMYLDQSISTFFFRKTIDQHLIIDLQVAIRTYASTNSRAGRKSRRHQHPILSVTSKNGMFWARISTCATLQPI